MNRQTFRGGMVSVVLFEHKVAVLNFEYDGFSRALLLTLLVCS